MVHARVVLAFSQFGETCHTLRNAEITVFPFMKLHVRSEKWEVRVGALEQLRQECA